MKKIVLPLLFGIGFFTPAVSLLAQPAGYALVTDADSASLVESNGTYVLTEYYCGKYGVNSYVINGQTFVNNPGRVGGAQYSQGNPVFTGSNPVTGGEDATNLAIISEGSQYNSTFDFTVPTTAGHNYVLELLFHDDAWSAAGQRAFNVYAGPNGSATNLLYANLDLAALGAGENQGEDVVLYYVQTNAIAGGIEVKMNATTNNALISGLLLLDMTGATNSPLVFVAPANASGFASFAASFSCVGVGAAGYTYQWQSAPAGNPNAWANLVNGSGGVSGANSAGLTLNNLSLSENGNLYQVVLSDAEGTATSSPPATLTVESVPPGLTGINSPSGLNTSGNFLIAEYYGNDYGPLAINGLTFINNNGRLNNDSPGNGIYTANTPNFGNTSSGTNLALISATDLYNTNGALNISVPTISGRSYTLQLVFHENFYSTVGSRVFNVSAGLSDVGVATWAQNIDLVQLGAYATQPEDAVMTTNFTGDGSAFEVNITAVTQNPLLCALSLADNSGAPVPPLINIEPLASTNIFAGRSFTLSAQVGGTPLVYQWQDFPIGGGSPTNNVANGVNNGATFFGATSNVLTVTNAQVAQTLSYQLDVGNSAANEATSTVAQVTVYVTNTVSPGNNYPYAILASNAVDYWQLNEPSGNPIVYDNGRDGNDGVAGSSVSLGNGSMASPAFPGFAANNSCMYTSANSVDGFITTAPLGFTASNLTMLVWLNPSQAQAPGAGIMLSRGNNTAGLTYGITLQSFADYSVRYFWNGYSADSGLQVPQNMWSLVGLVITPTNSSIYVLNSDSFSSAIFRSNNAACPFNSAFTIGNDPADGGNGARTYSGALDEPAVFTNALTFNQILGLYNVALGISLAVPTVSAPPSRTIIFPGANVTLSSTVAGTPTPALQWYSRPYGLTGAYQAVNNVGGITGAQSSSLNLPGALANAADYYLVASNTAGAVTSSVARVLVIENANTPALIGEWLNGPQSFNDVSGYNPASVHAGVMFGTTLWSNSAPAGFSGSCLSFNGGSALVITNTILSDSDYRLDFDHNITNRFSIAFWAQGFPSSQNAFVSKDGYVNQQGWSVEHDGNDTPNQPTLCIPGITSAQQQNDGSGVPVTTPNNWHHYCATYDAPSGIYRFYLDGVCVDYFDRDFPYVKVAATNHLVLGGGEQPTLANFLTGALFDVRLYNYAVQPAEVQAMISPPAAASVGLYLGATNSLVVGGTVGFAVMIPAGWNSLSPITVTLTNNSPGVALVEGESNNPFTVTFAQGGPTVQYFTLQAVGAGTIAFTASSPGLANGSLTDMVAVQVVEPALIGHWFAGPGTLADQSGYQPAGTEDGLASAGTSIGTVTPTYTTDVPPPFATNGNNNVAIGLTNYAVAINGTSQVGPGTYYRTFDEEIDNGFSFSFWAKGWTVGSGGFGNPWFSKNGVNNNIAGYAIRPNNAVAGPSFEVRYAAGAQNNSENEYMYNSIIVTNAPHFSWPSTWHHYACVWDGVNGFKKVYVDGVLAATVPNEYGPIAPPIDSMLVIGGMDLTDVDSGSAPNIGSYFTGEMFDVRMYDYPLAFSEVQSIYQVSSTNLSVEADTPIIDLGEQGMVSISLPLNANTTVANTIKVTNSNISAVSISTNGIPVTSSSFSITFPANSYPTARLLLTGLSNGFATITASGTGFNSAAATVRVCAPQLIAHWMVGSSNLTETSGFQPVGVHNLVPVTGAAGGDTVISFPSSDYSTIVPPGFPGASIHMTANYSLVVSNSDAVPGALLANGTGSDNDYQSTFDDVIANHFTIAFWENAPALASQGNWTAFVGKGGDDQTGFQVRRNGNTSTYSDAFTMYFSGSHIPTLSVANPNGQGLFNNSWTHVAIVHDGYNGYRAIYTNGILEMIQPSDYGAWSQAKHHHLIIGSEEQPVNGSASIEATQQPDSEDNSELNGYLYDFRVYNYALTPAQIQRLLTYTPPTLSVQQVGNQVQIYWSAVYPYPTYKLYTTTSLANPENWTDSGLAATTTQNGQYVATDTILPGAPQKFYKLKFVPQ